MKKKITLKAKSTLLGLMILIAGIASAQNVGIGTASPISKMDINGGITIGASYSGTNAAPTNGARIQGSVAIGLTTTPVEALDVNGAIHLGANASSTAGTIRWNSTVKDIEGYDGVLWLSHTGLMERSAGYLDDGN